MSYEVQHSGEVQINFDHLEIFTMRRNLGKLKFLLFASIRKTTAVFRTKPTSLVLAARTKPCASTFVFTLHQNTGITPTIRMLVD